LFQSWGSNKKKRDTFHVCYQCSRDIKESLANITRSYLAFFKNYELCVKKNVKNEFDLQIFVARKK